MNDCSIHDDLLEKYRLAFGISPSPMVLVDSDGSVLLTNAPFDALFEYEPLELIGQSIENLVPEDVRSAHSELREAHNRFPTKRAMGTNRDLAGMTKTGRELPLELVLEPVQDQGVQWSVVVAVDLSHRKAQEDRLNVMLDAASSGMILVDRSRKIKFVNTVLARLFGYDREELVGNTLDVLLPDGIWRAHSVYFENYMCDPGIRNMSHSNEIVGRHKSGSTIPLSIGLTPIHMPDMQMVMATVVDLSAQREAAKLDREKTEQLAALNAELTTFAYAASHDLKAPLLSISGLLSFLREDLAAGDTEEVLRNLDEMEGICSRAAQKVEKLLKLAKTDNSEITVKPIDLERMVNDIWTNQKGLMSKKCHLTLDLEDGVIVETDGALLQLVLENLISNAVKYRDEAKQRNQIAVRLQQIDDGWLISVQDNGVGIALADQEAVFEMFKRADDRAGDGLGLALVTRAINRLGASVDLESNPGEGSTFQLRLNKGGSEEKR